jgi:hypothetical protein
MAVDATRAYPGGAQTATRFRVEGIEVLEEVFAVLEATLAVGNVIDGRGRGRVALRKRSAQTAARVPFVGREYVVGRAEGLFVGHQVVDRLLLTAGDEEGEE